MSVTIKYKGNTIASANTDTTKTIKTSGKYCEADIVVENVQDGGITPSGSITLTSENTYDVTAKASAIVDFSATRANLAEAVTAKGVDTLPTASFDTIATNIGLIEGGGGSLPSSISRIDGGSFTLESDTREDVYKINHNLNAMPKGFIIWTEDLNAFQSTFAQRYAFYICYYDIRIEATANNYQYGWYRSIYRQTTGGIGSAEQSYKLDANPKQSDYVTPTTFRTNRNGDYYKAGCTYKWIAWA